MNAEIFHKGQNHAKSGKLFFLTSAWIEGIYFRILLTVFDWFWRFGFWIWKLFGNCILEIGLLYTLVLASPGQDLWGSIGIEEHFRMKYSIVGPLPYSWIWFLRNLRFLNSRLKI